MTDNSVHYYNHLLEITQHRNFTSMLGYSDFNRSLFLMGIQYRNYYRCDYYRYSLFFRNDAYP